MNLEELRSVQRTERQKDSLQHLRDSFYRDVADYIEELKAERERAAAEADDPFSSPDVGRLTDEIETAEEVVESLYERRVGKVVKRATFAAADMAAEEEGLTSEERELFDDLVARIKRNRQSVLDTLAGKHADEDETGGENAATTDPVAPPEAGAATDAGAAADVGAPADGDAPPAPPDVDPDSAPAPTPDPSAESPADDGGLLADAMRGDDASPPRDDGGRVTADDVADAEPTTDAEPTADGGTTPDADRTMVRITRDVGEIFGVDEREYDLEREDVVTLPTTNAEPLIDREAAEPLE
jgi:DNA replication factor GINS